MNSPTNILHHSSEGAHSISDERTSRAISGASNDHRFSRMKACALYNIYARRVTTAESWRRSRPRTRTLKCTSRTRHRSVVVRGSSKHQQLKQTLGMMIIITPKPKRLSSGSYPNRTVSRGRPKSISDKFRCARVFYWWCGYVWTSVCIDRWCATRVQSQIAILYISLKLL